MSNTLQEQEEFSCWKKIFRHLKAEGFDVYPPGVKEGKATTPYIAVRKAGTSEIPGISSNRQFYDIMLYVPHNMYSEIEILLNRVKESMDKLFPLVRPTRFVDTPFWDYEIKAWQTTIEYVNVLKSRRR